MGWFRRVAGNLRHPEPPRCTPGIVSLYQRHSRRQPEAETCRHPRHAGGAQRLPSELSQLERSRPEVAVEPRGGMPVRASRPGCHWRERECGPAMGDPAQPRGAKSGCVRAAVAGYPQSARRRRRARTAGTYDAEMPELANRRDREGIARDAHACKALVAFATRGLLYREVGPLVCSSTPRGCGAGKPGCAGTCHSS